MIFSAAENDIDLVAPRWMWKLTNDRNNVKNSTHITKMFFTVARKVKV